jgi:hypothetical protein
MTTIATANPAAYSAVASLLSSSASDASDNSQIGQSSTSDQAASSSSDPTDTVDLSDHAKATLARAKSEQAAADKLQSLVQSLSGNDGKKSDASKAKSDDGSSLFDKLSGSQTSPKSSDTQWVAGAPYGDASKSDAEFTETMKGTFVNEANAMDQAGMPEAAQALRNAVANGTVKYQKASEVPGLNFQSDVQFTQNPLGTIDTSVATNPHPTGEIKDAMAQGRAFAGWTPDRGDIYVTW